MSGLRFGYGTKGFANHRLADALTVIAELGYTGVALTLDHDHLDPFAPDLARRVTRTARDGKCGHGCEETAGGHGEDFDAPGSVPSEKSEEASDVCCGRRRAGSAQLRSALVGRAGQRGATHRRDRGQGHSKQPRLGDSAARRQPAHVGDSCG